MSSPEHRLENLLKSANGDRDVREIYKTIILLHCQYLRLSDERASEILKSFTVNIWRRRLTDPATFNKLIGGLWREIIVEAVETEVKRRLPKASEDEAFFLKKILSLRLF